MRDAFRAHAAATVEDRKMSKTVYSTMTSGRWTVLASCVLAATLFVGCGDRGKKQAAPPPPAEVSVAEVTQKTIPVIMRFAGTTESVRTVDIIPRVSGYIEKRSFEEGTYVEKGAHLYLVDPRPFKAALDAAQAQLEKDQASVIFWTSEADRYTRLAKTGAGSVEDKEKAIAKLAEVKAAIANDNANIETAKLNLAYTDITAPFAGRIENTRVYEGDVVTQQKDVLTTLVQINPIHVIFNVSRRQVAEIQKMQAQGLAPKERRSFEAHVQLPDGSTYDQVGHLDFVSAQVDPTTDSLEARAVFPNEAITASATVLLPGQYAPLNLVAGSQPDAVLIPEVALVQSQVGTHVMVVDKDNKVESRVVEVDRAYDGQWVIRKGLAKGEKVIVDGLQKVRSGVTVKVKQSDDADSKKEANQAKAAKTETTQEDTPPKKE